LKELISKMMFSLKKLRGELTLKNSFPNSIGKGAIFQGYLISLKNDLERTQLAENTARFNF